MIFILNDDFVFWVCKSLFDTLILLTIMVVKTNIEYVLSKLSNFDMSISTSILQLQNRFVQNNLICIQVA